MFLHEVYIQRFRGVEGPLTVELVSARYRTEEPPRPTLIFGENGSGKSTLCDALEFGVRGALSRRHVGGKKRSREIQNLLVPGAPSVRLTLSNSTDVVRGEALGSRQSTREPLNEFKFSPLIIRRNAIENFWSIPEEDRLDFFWDYLAPNPASWRQREDNDAIRRHDEAERELADAATIIQRLIPKDHSIDGHPFTLPRHSGGMKALEFALRAERSNLDGRRLSAVAESALNTYRAAVDKEVSLKSAANAARGKTPRTSEEIASVLRDAAPRIEEDFLAVAQLTWLDSVEVAPSTTPESAELSIKLRTRENKKLDALTVLSEAYLDLLALLVIVEVQIACHRRGQAPVIIFDDVFQSVDAPLRQRALRVLLKRLSGWQVVITVHDRLWLRFAERVLKQEGFQAPHILELHAVPGARTPTVTGGGTGPLRDVEFVKNNNGSAVLLAGAVGRAVEELLDQCTLTYGARIVRRPNYTIQVLMDALTPIMNNAEDPDIRTRFRRLKHAQFLRNELGAHYNEDADSVSAQEVADAAEDVIVLWKLLTCPMCGKLGEKQTVENGKWEVKHTCCPSPTPSTQIV